LRCNDRSNSNSEAKAERSLRTVAHDKPAMSEHVTHTTETTSHMSGMHDAGMHKGGMGGMHGGGLGGLGGLLLGGLGRL
jgi:hypothetical protein